MKAKGQSVSKTQRERPSINIFIQYEILCMLASCLSYSQNLTNDGGK